MSERERSDPPPPPPPSAPPEKVEKGDNALTTF